LTAFAFAPGGLILITERTGKVRVVKPPLDAVAGSVVTGSVTLPCTTEPQVTKPVVVVAAAASSQTKTKD